MKVLLEKGLFDLDGNVIESSANMPATIRGVCIEALLVSYTDEVNLTGEEKLARWLLATKLKVTSKEVELTVEEIAKIKKLVGKAFGPLVVGQVWATLEGE